MSDTRTGKRPSLTMVRALNDDLVKRLRAAEARIAELEGRLASYHCAQAGLSCRSDFPPAGAKWTPYCEVHNIRAERDRAIEQAAELEAELAGYRERERRLREMVQVYVDRSGGGFSYVGRKVLATLDAQPEPSQERCGTCGEPIHMPGTPQCRRCEGSGHVVYSDIEGTNSYEPCPDCQKEQADAE